MTKFSKAFGFTVVALSLSILSACSTGVSPGSKFGPAPTSVSVARADVGSLMNSFRQSKGLKPLSENAQLRQAAQAYANEMSRQNHFSHTGRNGSSVMSRILATGYGGCGFTENIARGQTSALEVHQAWVKSPGHYKNMMRVDSREYGVGYTPDGKYWVVNFGMVCGK